MTIFEQNTWLESIVNGQHLEQNNGNWFYDPIENRTLQQKTIAKVKQSEHTAAAADCMTTFKTEHTTTK